MKNQLSRQYIYGCANVLQASVRQPAVFPASVPVLWRQAESELSSPLNFLTGRKRSRSSRLLSARAWKNSTEDENKQRAIAYRSNLSPGNLSDISLDPADSFEHIEPRQA